MSDAGDVLIAGEIAVIGIGGLYLVKTLNDQFNLALKSKAYANEMETKATETFRTLKIIPQDSEVNINQLGSAIHKNLAGVVESAKGTTEGWIDTSGEHHETMGLGMATTTVINDIFGEPTRVLRDAKEGMNKAYNKLKFW